VRYRADIARRQRGWGRRARTWLGLRLGLGLGPGLGLGLELGLGLVEHVPQLIHAPPPRTARHLPELIGAQGAVAREVAVVGLVELREHHGARLGRIRG